jgi:type I restriction enzyme M protein
VPESASDADQKKYLRSGAFTGWEIVDNTARLCAMNVSRRPTT